MNFVHSLHFVNAVFSNNTPTPPKGRCVLLLVRTRSAHHRHKAWFRRHARPIKYTTKMKAIFFPTVTKSGLMNLYLNQEHLNSSISLSSNS